MPKITRKKKMKEALRIAGCPKDLIDKAVELMDTKELSVEKAIAKLTGKQKQVPDTVLGIAFSDAGISSDTQIAAPSSLDELNELKDALEDVKDVQALTPEQIAEMEERRRERKTLAQGVAEKLPEILQNIAILERLGEEDMSDEQKAQLKKLKIARDKIQNLGDEGFKKGCAFAGMIKAIREAEGTELNLKNFIRAVESEGRYRQATKNEVTDFRINRKWPYGTIFTPFGTYVLITAGAEFSKESQHKLGEVMLDLTVRCRKTADERAKNKMAALKEIGNPDLSSFLASLLHNTFIPEDTYRLEIPDPKTPGQLMGVGLAKFCSSKTISNNGEGQGSIEVLEIIDGAGSLGWMEKSKGTYVTMFYLFNPRPEKALTENKKMPEELKKISSDLIKAFWNAFGHNMFIMKQLIQEGNPNLNEIGDRAIQCQKFLLQFPPSERFPEGKGIIEIQELPAKDENPEPVRVIKVIVGCGSLAYFNRHRGKRGIPVPLYFNVKFEELIGNSKTMSDEDKAVVIRIIRTTRDAAYAYKNKRKADNMPADEKGVGAKEKEMLNNSPGTEQIAAEAVV